MLGKCIKNEFVNRIKQALGIIFILIGMAIFVRIIDEISDVACSSVLDAFSTLTKLAYVIIVIGAMVMTAFLPFLDFRQRFYKDQAYLTHTLPVKVSTMLIARMICDVVITIFISISWVVSLCIAIGVNFYSDIIEFMKDIMELFGENTAVENSLLIGILILFVVGACFTTLNTIWMTNAAYSFGHAFSKNKRLLSIVGAVGLYSIEMFVLALVMYTCEHAGLMTELEIDHVGDVTVDLLKSILQMFVIMDSYAIIIVFAMGGLTNFICKRHLNVE